ncbi:MAG: hypothetical protein ACK5BV_06480 [Bacteroidota bacterium]|jgi:hypothetical protein
MQHLITLMLCLWAMNVHAQHLPDPLLSAVVGVGGYSKSNTDVFGALCNPASVANVENFTVGIYGERKFLLTGLQQFCGVVAIPLPSSGVGLQLDYVGSSLMNETAIGLVYGRRLGDRMVAGVRFRYYGLRVPGYVQASALWAEAGVTYQLSDRIRAGFSFSRSTNNKIHNEEPDLSQSFRMGVGYEASSRLFIMSEWVKETRKEIQGNVVLLYAFEEGFRLRMGWHTYTSQPIIGAGLYWQKTWIDILFAYHPYLGFTPGLQCVFSPKEKKVESK